MRLTVLALLLAAAPAWAQIVRTDIKDTLINSSSASAESTGSSCATSSRTFDGSTQYLTNANGSHATLEAGAGVDTAAAVWFYNPGTSKGTLYSNGGSVPGTLLYVDATGRLVGILYTAAGNHTAQVLTPLVGAGWHYGFLHADRDGLLTACLDASACKTVDISSKVAESLANTAALQFAKPTVGTMFAGRIAISAVWVGTVPSVAQLQADYQAGVPVATCAAWSVAATSCWTFTGAAGANELDQIGSVDLTQVASPGSADGPGEGCE
jgi:hypothetical protein